jgi:hypothetical protein
MSDHLFIVTVVQQFIRLALVRFPVLSKVASKLPGEWVSNLSHDTGLPTASLSPVTALLVECAIAFSAAESTILKVLGWIPSCFAPVTFFLLPIFMLPVERNYRAWRRRTTSDRSELIDGKDIL